MLFWVIKFENFRKLFNFARGFWGKSCKEVITYEIAGVGNLFLNFSEPSLIFRWDSLEFPTFQIKRNLGYPITNYRSITCQHHHTSLNWKIHDKVIKYRHLAHLKIIMQHRFTIFVSWLLERFEQHSFEEH